MSTISTTRLMLAAAALASFGAVAPAIAADAPAAQQQEAVSPEMAALVANLKAADSKEARDALIQAALKANPKDASKIMAAVKALAPELSKDTMATVVAVLSEKPENKKILDKVTQENEDVVAQIAGDVQPAAGPDAGGDDAQDFTVTDNNADNGNDAAQENPGQLSDTPAASPGSI